MGASDKVIRGIEVGTKAGYLVLFGVIGFALWQFFGPKKAKSYPVPAPVGPAKAGAPVATQASPPEGVVLGNASQALRAQIIDPPNGGQVERGAFSSTFAGTIEVVNETDQSQDVVVDVKGDYYELTGGSRLDILTSFQWTLGAGEVKRFDVKIETGNSNDLVFEFGQANAVFEVRTNGVVTQSTGFYVA